MGRVRLQLKKIENKTYRHITFAKRKSGLVKKAYELSTLCDVEVALIIFSPAGKLILFDGKKRLEEIFMRYIDLPHHQRGRLRDHELVRRIIIQMSLEAELRHRLSSYGNSDRENKISIDSQLEETKNKIRIYSAELEDVEKQLQYFLKSPSSIKSASEAEFLEGILEDTLKLVCLHKHDLEAKNNMQLVSEKRPSLHPQSVGSNIFVMGSSNYCLENLPQKHAAKQVLTTNKFSHSTGFQSFMMRDNQSQPLAEMPPSSMPNLFGTGYPTANIIVSSAGPEFFSANFPHVFNTNQEGRRSGTNERNKVVDATVASNGRSSQYGDGRGMPFLC